MADRIGAGQQYRASKPAGSGGVQSSGRTANSGRRIAVRPIASIRAAVAALPGSGRSTASGRSRRGRTAAGPSGVRVEQIGRQSPAARSRRSCPRRCRVTTALPSSANSSARKHSVSPCERRQRRHRRVAVGPSAASKRTLGQHAGAASPHGRSPQPVPARSSSARTSIPTAPWAGAGSMTSTGIASADVAAPEPVEPRGREQRRVDLARRQLGEPRVDIAAEQDDREGRAASRSSCARASAGCRADHRTRRAAPRSMSAPISRSRTSARGSIAAIAIASGRIVSTSFIECTAKSISPVEQRAVELLGPQRLAADLGERAVLDAVAGGA